MQKKRYLSLMALLLCVCFTFGFMTLSAQAAIRADEEATETEGTEATNELGIEGQAEGEYETYYSEVYGLFFDAPVGWVFTDAIAVDEEGQPIPDGDPAEVDPFWCVPVTLTRPLPEDAATDVPVLLPYYVLSLAEMFEGMEIEDTDACKEVYTQFTIDSLNAQNEEGIYENIEIANVSVSAEEDTTFGSAVGVFAVADSTQLPGVKVNLTTFYVNVEGTLLLVSLICDMNDLTDVGPVAEQIMKSLAIGVYEEPLGEDAEQE